jgi:hypothetical protein
VNLAEKVGGRNHGFKYIQTPVNFYFILKINVMMPEAFA